MGAFLKFLVTAGLQVLAVYFAGKEREAKQEADREKQEAIDAGKRIADRADNAGELRDKFAARAATANDNPNDAK